MLADVPRGCGECGNQASRENTASLQRSQAEDFSGMRGVVAPVVDDVKNLRADDSAEDDEDAKVPGVVSVDAMLLGVANANPKTDEDSECNQKSVSR